MSAVVHNDSPEAVTLFDSHRASQQVTGGRSSQHGSIIVKFFWESNIIFSVRRCIIISAEVGCIFFYINDKWPMVREVNEKRTRSYYQAFKSLQRRV